MKILLVGPLPEPMHGCSYANQVFERMARRAGHAIRTVNTSTSIISGIQGDVFSLRKALSFLRVYRSLPLVIWSDVLYLTPGQTLFGVLKYAPFMTLARWLRRSYVIHVHGNHLGKHFFQLRGWKRRIFHHYVAGARSGIVLSNSLRENFNGLLSPDRVYVVENFAANELAGQDAGDKPRDMLRVLYLSNLMREKGILELLEALRTLKRRGVDYQAYIAGRLEEGIESEVRAFFDELSPEVVYIGSVSGQNKIDILRCSNCFVLPTYYTMEGQPIALLEGMATGNIIVTTRHAGIPDIVDASNGYLVAVRDTEALTNCLLAIAGNLSSELDRVAQHNIDVVASRFTEQKFSSGIIHVLEDALKLTPAEHKP